MTQLYEPLISRYKDVLVYTKDNMEDKQHGLTACVISGKLLENPLLRTNYTDFKYYVYKTKKDKQVVFF